MSCLKNQFITYHDRSGNTFAQKFWYYGGFFFSYFIFNIFTTFGIVLIDASIKSNSLIWNGGIQVANVGEITPYYLVISQLLLTIAVSMVFLVTRRSYKNGWDNPMAVLLTTSLLFGIVMMLFFMLFAWLYQWYLASGHYAIMHIVREAGNWFLFTFAPIIVVDSLNVSFLTMLLRHKGPKYVFWLTFVKDFFALLFSYFLCCLTPANVFGFIAGFMIANIPFLVGNFIYFHKFIYRTPWIIRRADWSLLIKDLTMYAFKDMWPQILKALVVIIIAFTLFKHISPTLSGFYYSRINWYMFLYLLPFLTAPTHLTFQVVKNLNPQKYNFWAHPQNKVFFESVYAVVFAITILCMVGFYFAMDPLNAFYIQNIPQWWLLKNQSEQISGQGISYFLILPNSLSYIFVAIYVFFMAYGFYYSDKMQYLIPKGGEKISPKGLIGSLVGSFITVAFIVGLGMGLMNKGCWVFAYMSSYSFSMVIVSVIVWILCLVFYLITKQKATKAMKKAQAIPQKVVSK